MAFKFKGREKEYKKQWALDAYRNNSTYRSSVLLRHSRWYKKIRDTITYRKILDRQAEYSRRQENRAAINKSSRKYYRNNLNKIKARILVRVAINRGDIVRPKRCECCHKSPGSDRLGRSLLQAHHADYSKPFEIAWLCWRCHSKLKRRIA